MAMKMPFFLNILVAFCIFLLPFVISDDIVCSVPNPDSSQVCIAIRFPWEKDAVYFCTAKTNLIYTSQCDKSLAHCYDDGRNDTLKIATPWDCCPIISTPNYCHNVRCSPKPYNRDCREIRTPGACCPEYFCDKGEPEDCKMRLIKAACSGPPPGKGHCLGFRDPYGCCNVFQCPEEEKPGKCPRLRVGERRSREGPVTKFFNGIGMGKAVKHVKTAVRHVTNSATNLLHNHGGTIGKRLARMIPQPFTDEETPFYRCIGDSSCPDNLKCCPISPVINKLTDGVCLQPVSTGTDESIRSTNIQSSVNNAANSPHNSPGSGSPSSPSMQNDGGQVRGRLDNGFDGHIRD